MSLNPGIAQQEVLAETIQRARVRMSRAERSAEWVISGGFVVAAAVLWIAAPPHALAIGSWGLCLALMVLSTLVRFDTPHGFTVATQLAFVPLLFDVPLALVPPTVVLALAIARLPTIRSGRVRPIRLLHVLGNAWFSIGPVAVFVIAGISPRHADGWLLLLALGAQFLLDAASSTIRLAIARDVPLSDLFGDSWLYGVDAALSAIGLVVAELSTRAPVAPLALLPLLGLLAIFAGERRNRLEQLLELNSAYRGTALVLGNVIEADDGYTGEHCRSVVALTMAVADQLGLDAERRRNLEFSALLHDVGKIAIPKEIINKPGKLDPREWSLIRTHTVEGQKMLDTIGGFMRDVGLIVRSHHERWDGGGYPDGLAGEAIPLEARIIACCDTWNAMRSDRSYRRALPLGEALTELRQAAGGQLDPTVVAAMLEVALAERAPESLAV